MARVAVEPPTFRFSAIGMTVHRIPATPTTCIIALNLNTDERRRTSADEPKDETTTTERRWSLILADLLVASVVPMVALAPSRRDPSGAIDSGDAAWMIVGRRSGDPEPADSRTGTVVSDRWRPSEKGQAGARLCRDLVNACDGNVGFIHHGGCCE